MGTAVRADTAACPTVARRTRRLATSVVVTSLLVAACGSTSDDTEPALPDPAATPTTTSSTTQPNTPSTTPPTTPGPTEPTDANETSTMTTEPEPTAPVASVDDPSDTAGPSDCRRITDFDIDGDPGWVVVDDGVMGGRSTGVVDIGGSVMRFSGSVVTDGGGFTSVRHRLDGEEMAFTTRMTMRIRTDGRVYGVTLQDDAEIDQRSVSHRADLDTSGVVDADGWALVTVEYARLRPSVFGRSVEAPAFDAGAAREIGIIISDGVDGDFSLDVDWIDVCS